MLQINNLTKTYGSVTVLDIENLSIGAGEKLGVVGNNGAGKTTLFRLILDLIKPTTGEVLIEGQNVATGENWKKYTGSFIDEKFLIDYLTPDEYFGFLARIYGMNHTDVSTFLGQFEMLFNDEVLNRGRYIRDLSKGNKKKVGIAAALIGKPQLVLLDEPFENLDPTSQLRLHQIINSYQSSHNTTFLLSSHDLNHVTSLSTRIVLLEKGALRVDEPVDDATLNRLQDYFTADFSS